MKKHIPNALTSMNVLSGCIASVMAFEGHFLWVVIWVIVGAICDFFDGFSARMLNAYSPIGKDLDSLADMISFGMAPAIMVFTLLSGSPYLLTLDPIVALLIPYLSFILVIASALRLAKFNIDERQTSSFIGLNTPANALFWISLCYGIHIRSILVNSIVFYLILALIAVFALLMIAEIPMFSLKIKNMKPRGNEFRYLLILFMLTAIILWGIIGIAAGIVFYILLSIISSKLKPSGEA